MSEGFAASLLAFLDSHDAASIISIVGSGSLNTNSHLSCQLAVNNKHSPESPQRKKPARAWGDRDLSPSAVVTSLVLASKMPTVELQPLPAEGKYLSKFSFRSMALLELPKTNLLKSLAQPGIAESWLEMSCSFCKQSRRP